MSRLCKPFRTGQAQEHGGAPKNGRWDKGEREEGWKLVECTENRVKMPACDGLGTVA